VVFRGTHRVDLKVPPAGAKQAFLRGLLGNAARLPRIQMLVERAT